MGHHPLRRARQDAERVRSKAFWNAIFRLLRGVPNELLPFEAVRGLRPHSESYSGVRAIPLEQIVGSVDRYKDFGHYFLPRYSLPLERWVRVRQARLEGKDLPAIQVYQVGEVYFVKDGHHRVSVALEEGQAFIDAEVTQLAVTVSPVATDGVKDLILKGEYAQFLEASRLNRLRPGHRPILFTVAGRYERLLEHLRIHQYLLGQRLEREIHWEEAVQSWYDTLYRPLTEEIFRHGILKRFPGRGEADLYLWIMDHRHYLKEQIGFDLGPQWSALDYARSHAPHRAQRTWQRFRQAWRGAR